MSRNFFFFNDTATTEIYTLSLHDALPISPSRERRPRVAITFDDGYRGAVTLAVEELAQRGVPATLFVAPAFVGRGTFWWDVVAPGLDGDLREHAIWDLGGEDHAVRRWAVERGLGSHPVPEYA